MALFRLMEWAWLAHWVRLKLLVHGERVGVHEVAAVCRGRGETRRVMDKLCRWADCSAVVLELTPSGRCGADVGRLAGFYVSLGFVPNGEVLPLFRWRGEMVRYPVPGRRHGLR